MRKTNDDTIIKMLGEGKTQKQVAEHFGVSPAAICKRLKRIMPVPEAFGKLTAKEQRFALEVAKGKNRTQAAMVSHDCSSLASAKSMGSQLLAKSDIQTAVAEIMQIHGLTRSYRVLKLKEHVDNVDPNVSLKALDQTWKLDGAYSEEKVHLVVDHKTLLMELDELEKEEERLKRELAGE